MSALPQRPVTLTDLKREAVSVPYAGGIPELVQRDSAANEGARQVLSLRMEDYEVDGKGVVEGYIALFREFNAHNDYLVEGCFEKAIRERFDQLKPNMHHSWLAPLAPRADELHEDTKGLFHRITITGHDDPDLNRRNYLLLKERLIDGVSMEFDWSRSSSRPMTDKEVEDAGGLVRDVWWLSPMLYDEVFLLGWGYVLHPSAEGARVEAVRDIMGWTPGRVWPGWTQDARQLQGGQGAPGGVQMRFVPSGSAPWGGPAPVDLRGPAAPSPAAPPPVVTPEPDAATAQRTSPLGGVLERLRAHQEDTMHKTKQRRALSGALEKLRAHQNA